MSTSQAFTMNLKSLLAVPIRIILLQGILFFIVLQQGYSQEKIKSAEVDIVKPYQPLLADAEKITFKAQAAEVDSSIKSLEYNVETHLIEVPFIPAEIRVVALPKEIETATQNNSLKAGIGTQLTPLLDLNLHSGKSDKFSYGLNIYHLSSNGSKIDYQDFSRTGGTLGGKSYFGGTALWADVGYHHRKNYNYAAASADSGADSKSLFKRTYDYLPISIGFQNTKLTKAGFNYNFEFDYHHFVSKPHNSWTSLLKEDFFDFNAGIQKTIAKIHSANVDFEYQKLWNNFAEHDTSQMVYSIVPFYQLHHEKGNLILGINVSVFDKEVSFFPKVQGEYKLIGDYLIPYAGWLGRWEPSTMNQLTTINPYLGDFETNYSKINEGFAGIKGSYGNNISYNLKAGYQVRTNMPFYLPDSLMPSFYDVVYYYEAKIFNVHAEVGYRQSERVNILLMAETNSFDLDFEDQPWGIPKSMLDFTLNYNIQNKIFLQTDVFAKTGAYTILPGDSTSTQLKERIDANLSVNYQYKENIGFWLAFNNIFAAKSSTWYNYPTYGFQVLAGAQLKF